MKKQVIPPGAFSPRYDLPTFDPSHWNQGDPVSVTPVIVGDFARFTYAGDKFYEGNRERWSVVAPEPGNRPAMVAMRYPGSCFYGVNTPDGFRCFDVVGVDGYFLPLDVVRTIGMIPVDEIYRGPLVLGDLQYMLSKHPAGLVVQAVNGERVKEVLK